MFRLVFKASAVEDLAEFRKADRQRVLAESEEQLAHAPEVPTRRRKPLRPNPLATWELRVGDFRVFYDVDRETETVRVIAVGRKAGNRLTIRGREFDL